VRQAKTECVEAAFEIRAAAGTGMHGNPRGLVDNQDQPVTIKDAIRQRSAELAKPGGKW
jgi:hypothetical protein